MKQCPVCSKELQDGFVACPYCGASLSQEQAPPNPQPFQQPQEQQQASYQQPQPTYQQQNTVQQLSNMSPEQRDIYDNKFMSVLSYISVLVFIPIFAGKDSKFARFHANQGFILFIFEAAYWIATSVINVILGWIFWPLRVIFSVIFGLLGLTFLVFSLLGIVNAVQGQYKKLPFIGDLFKLFKDV